MIWIKGKNNFERIDNPLKFYKFFILWYLNIKNLLISEQNNWFLISSKFCKDYNIFSNNITLNEVTDSQKFSIWKVSWLKINFLY